MSGAWTAEREAQLIDLVVGGRYSRAEMARIIGVSRSAVIGKMNRLGINTDPGAEPEQRRISASIRANAQRQTYASTPARRTAPTPQPEPLVLVTEHQRPWIERGPRQCVWIVAFRGADSVACCAPTAEGAPFGWCEAHARKGINPRARKPQGEVSTWNRQGNRKFA